MVKPVYLQDNISKAVLAQQYFDLEYEGAERLRAIHRQVTMREQERKEQEQTPQMEERPGTSGIHPDGSSAGRGGRQEAEARLRKPREDTEQTEVENDLRFRRPEDDEGKGSKLDLEG